VRVEVAQGVAAIKPETYDDDRILVQVCSQPTKDRRLGARRQKWHDVAGDHRRVKWLGLPEPTQIQVAEIGDKPNARWVISPCRLDEVFISVHADHEVPAGGQLGAHPARAASRVEHPGSSREHGVEQAGFSAKFDPLRGHPAETLDVPPGMTGVVLRHPPRRLAHTDTISTRAAFA
jgi:hypothetical protein